MPAAASQTVEAREGGDPSRPGGVRAHFVRMRSVFSFPGQNERAVISRRPEGPPEEVERALRPVDRPREAESVVHGGPLHLRPAPLLGAGGG